LHVWSRDTGSRLPMLISIGGANVTTTTDGGAGDAPSNSTPPMIAWAPRQDTPVLVQVNVSEGRLQVYGLHPQVLGDGIQGQGASSPSPRRSEELQSRGAHVGTSSGAEGAGGWIGKLKKKRESLESLVKGSGADPPQSRRQSARKDVSRVALRRRSVSPPRVAGTSASHIEKSRVAGTVGGPGR
jgi:hypothetical protein